MPLLTAICATTPPVGCWIALTLDCTTRLPGTTTAPDKGTSVIQPPANPPTTSSARSPVRNSPSKARAARSTMLSPGAPAATSADPSRLARNATPAVRPLRTTPVTERSRGTAPAGLGGANWGASMRGGCRLSSICKASGRDFGMYMSDGSSGAMIGPRAGRSFSQELPAEAWPAGPRAPPAGGGVMNCGSRVLRPPRGAGGSGSRTSDWDPKGPSQSSTRPILPFFFARFGRAWRERREPGRGSSFAGRRSGGRWSCRLSCSKACRNRCSSRISAWPCGAATSSSVPPIRRRTTLSSVCT